MKYENYTLIQENWNKFASEVTEDETKLDEGRAAKLAATALDGAVGLGVALDLAGFSDMVLTTETAPALIGYALYRLVQTQSKKTGKSPKDIIVNHLDAIDNNPRASAVLRYLAKEASVIIAPKGDDELSDPKALEAALAPVVDKTKDAIQNDPSFKDADPSADKSKASMGQPVPVKITE